MLHQRAGLAGLRLAAQILFVDAHLEAQPLDVAHVEVAVEQRVDLATLRRGNDAAGCRIGGVSGRRAVVIGDGSACRC